MQHFTLYDRCFLAADSSARAIAQVELTLSAAFLKFSSVVGPRPFQTESLPTGKNPDLGPVMIKSI